MFNDPSSPIGDELMYPFVLLGKKLAALGHKAATLDTDSLEKFDAAVFLDHPTFLNPYFRQLQKMPDKKRYLFLFENVANRPDNYWLKNHADFDKVFTWNPTLVDNKKYFQFFLPNRIPTSFSINPAEKTKFCVTIASQKYSGHAMELYSERVRAIRWFEQNHPGEFDLFGTLWDRRFFKGPLSRLNLGLLKLYSYFPQTLRTKAFDSHRGTVTSKNATMRQYKFAICYENAVLPGYITEKIFDGMFAGCIPIYLGAPDVTDYIPKEAFIDKRNFKTYDDLYRYLKNMSEPEYLGYLQAIEKFVDGKKIHPFSAESFAETIITHIAQPQAS